MAADSTIARSALVLLISGLGFISNANAQETDGGHDQLVNLGFLFVNGAYIERPYVFRTSAGDHSIAASARLATFDFPLTILMIGGTRESNRN